MNKDNAHLYLPLVQALADGRKLQWRNGDEWHDFSTPFINFTDPPENYRIAPLEFPPLPEGEEWHNPEGLTPEQFGPRYRPCTVREFKSNQQLAIKGDRPPGNIFAGGKWASPEGLMWIAALTYALPSDTPIARAPEKQPLTLADIKPGCAIRRKILDGWMLVNSASKEGVRHRDIGNGITFTYFESLAHCGWEYSNDNGQTWNPCHKLV